MTTKKFSALTLPHPRYSCQIGCCDVTSSQGTSGDLARWLPKFTDLIQLIEVRRTGCLSESVLKPGSSLKPLLAGSCIVIDNARPELFLRRDFLASFVDQGSVYVAAMWPESSCFAAHQYQISCQDNVLSILLNEKQYRRFGLIAKKVTGAGSRQPTRRAGSKSYRIDIDLKDDKIKESNKYQDRLVTTLRRLSPISKLYFRFAPRCEPGTNGGPELAPGDNLNQQQTNEKCLEFFKFVMREYAEDGLKPVPLTGCSVVRQKLARCWTNYSQAHPNLHLPLRELHSASASAVDPPVQRNMELLNGVVELVDWLGYQVLSLNCERPEIHSSSTEPEGRLDVACCQVSGLVDSQALECGLHALLTAPPSGHQDYMELRAVILYESAAPATLTSGANHGAGNAAVVLIQDYTESQPRVANNLITALAMSSLPF